ncbi:MAG: hypothetical protein WC284_08250 [Candidimonas sp.]
MSADALIPVYYRVEIDLSGYTGLTSPNDGTIDNTKPELYAADGGTYPSTKNNSLAKERANIRWQEILRRVSENISPISVTQIVKGGSPDNDTPPTSIDFTLGYDREEYIFTVNEEGIPSSDDMLYGEEALIRQIARALTTSRNDNRDIYNPEAVGLNAQGMMIERVDVGELDNDIISAEAVITVTRIDDIS